jgi:D-3-phosphoglycerate dehydrogenase
MSDQPKPTSLDKNKIKIVLFEGIHASAVDCFAEAGYYQLVQFPHAGSGPELRAAIADCHILGVRSRTHLTAADLQAARRLFAVGCFCIGTSHVDLAAAMALGIPVFNAPYANTRSVAEMVIAETILLLRRIPEKEHAARRGVWRKDAAGSNEARGKTLGIVGYGNIGTQVSVLAEAIGMKVVFADVVTKLPLGNARQVSLKQLLSVADAVSLHVPDSRQNRRMIGAAQLAWMRPDAVLINAARGSLVDLDALDSALAEGRLRGAAIDVFPEEPASESQPFSSCLLQHDNVMLTPHIGGSTIEAQQNIGREVAEKLVRYSDLGGTVSAVNFPEVALPAHADQHRLLHIHRNQPGVLSQINQVFSANQINILGQYLQTNPQVGYVVVDIDRESSELALHELRKIDGTIKCRVLW